MLERTPKEILQVHDKSDSLEQNIDRLDLQCVEGIASADGAFAARMELAIENGRERDVTCVVVGYGTERPTAMIVPAPYLPEQIPVKPARAKHIAYRLARQIQREERANALARQDEKSAPASEIPLGTLTILDLRPQACRYSANESSLYFFCGAPTGAEQNPYCPRHDRLCRA